MSLTPHIALLTGGRDRPYVLGLTKALVEEGVHLDLIGSDELEDPAFRASPQVNFMNFRGNLRAEATAATKVARVIAYYMRLVVYAATAKPRIFHILWNNKFETFDRTLLMLFYRALGKRILLTVHNVNAGERDRTDGVVNRWTLSAQYQLASHLFVHTDKMKEQMVREFDIAAAKVTVIPFGINNAVPVTALTESEAKKRLGVAPGDRTLLFFGKIAPYKGLDYLVDAFQRILTQHSNCRLIVAGTPRGGAEEYWEAIETRIEQASLRGILRRIEFIPDDETEVYFKAADVLMLPYTHVFQSGVLFLGYSFGLPVIASDVGSLAEDVIDGRTGFMCKPADTADLARAIERYLASELAREPSRFRNDIRDFAGKRHSWDTVAKQTVHVYQQLSEPLRARKCDTTDAAREKM
jgi:glycosyltransferase involved in cell wall biosynthesis